MRFTSAFFALILVLSFMTAETAVAAEPVRSPAAGKFSLEIGDNDAGFVQSVEGGSASEEKVQERPAPQPISPQANVPPRAIGTLRQPCLHPPCSAVGTIHKTSKGLGTKTKNAEATDTPQNSGDTGNGSTADNPKN